MTVTSGFFNSVNHDRKYNAEEISSIFDGIILDGVYQGFGEALKVSGTSVANQVKVGTGRAWFNHTWTLNDEALYLTLPGANSTYPRIDAIILEVNNSSSIRANTIKCISGTAASSPTKPTLTNTTNVHQYPLAYITRPKGSSTINTGDIENKIGSSDCPIVTGVLEVLSDDRFIAQTIANLTTDFNTWFDGVKGQLSGDVAANLANQISELTSKVNANTIRIQVLYNNSQNIPKGKLLGTSISDSDLAKIHDGTFDCYIGDYWKINNTTYYVVGIDTYINTDIECDVKDNHHLIILPMSSSIQQYPHSKKSTYYHSHVATPNDRVSYFSVWISNKTIMNYYLIPHEDLCDVDDSNRQIIYNDIGKNNIKTFPVITNDGFCYYKYVAKDMIILPAIHNNNVTYDTTSTYNGYVIDEGNSGFPFVSSAVSLISLKDVVSSVLPYWRYFEEVDPMYKLFSKCLTYKSSDYYYTLSIGDKNFTMHRGYDDKNGFFKSNIQTDNSLKSSGHICGYGMYLFNDKLKNNVSSIYNRITDAKYYYLAEDYFTNNNKNYNIDVRTVIHNAYHTGYSNQLSTSYDSNNIKIEPVSSNDISTYKNFAPYNAKFFETSSSYMNSGNLELIFAI